MDINELKEVINDVYGYDITATINYSIEQGHSAIYNGINIRYLIDSLCNFDFLDDVLGEVIDYDVYINTIISMYKEELKRRKYKVRYYKATGRLFFK